MAALTITASALLAGSNANIKHGMSGAAIAAGKSVYLDPDDNLVKLADNDAVSTDEHDAVGISLNATAAAAQPVSYIKSGDLAFGAILTKGETYCVGGTAGDIVPRADVTTGDELVILGIASTTSNLQVGVRDTNTVL